jgi:hypothetical protein
MFTPAPETRALLQRFSAATRQPTSSIVRELLQSVGPHLEMMVDLLERTSQLNDEVREAANAAAQHAGEALIPLLQEANRAMTNLQRIVDEPGLPLSALKPPSSNTGATSSQQGKREAA